MTTFRCMTVFAASWLLLAGCASSDETPTAAAVDPHPHETPELALAHLDRPVAEHVLGETLLVISPTEIRFGDHEIVAMLTEGRLMPEPIEEGERGLLIPTLRMAAHAQDAAQQDTLFIDRNVPYLTLTRALYTLGQTGRSCLAFAVDSPDGRALLPLHLPTSSPVHREGEERGLELTFELRPDGILVYGSGGVLARGCRTISEQRIVTIPNREGMPDLDALRRCVGLVKDTFPTAVEVTLTASPITPFQQIAAVIATAQSDGPRELFPRVMLATPWREGAREVQTLRAVAE